MRFQHDQWQYVLCAHTVEADSDAQVAGNMFLIGIIEVAVKTPEKKHTVLIDFHLSVLYFTKAGVDSIALQEKSVP